MDSVERNTASLQQIRMHQHQQQAHTKWLDRIRELEPHSQLITQTEINTE